MPPIPGNNVDVDRKQGRGNSAALLFVAQDGSSLLHAVFVGGDHLFDHLTADAAGLTGRQITVVALLEVYAHFGGGLHFEAVHRLAGIGVDQIVAVGSSHFVFHLLFVFWVS